MSYIPHTEQDRQQMLAAIGVTTIEDLFDAVPASHRFPKIDIPPALSEYEIAAELKAYAEANDHAGNFAVFRGAGAYHHFVPSAVNHLLLRGEFFTAYTPYQPELSQGTLQAVFEYQSMMCALTGMDAANASHYDGATSLAEAVTVALDVTRFKRNKIVLSGGIHPQYREVVRTYHQGRQIEIVGDDQPRSAAELATLVDSDTAMVAVQYPNFFGQIEDVKALAEKAHAVGALLVAVVNPVALGILKSPADLGAAIAVGEGQPLGVGLQFGGPYLGFFSIKQEYVRKIAGRIVGETIDSDGRRAYVMTLRPREQDIKREKASSNICTNQGLMALAACVYMSLLGKNGLRHVAELCYHKAHYAAAEIEKLAGFSVDRSLPFFNEFVVKCPVPVEKANAALLEQGIIGGYDLGADYPHLAGHMLIAVTETNSKAEIDALVETLKALT
ncbi:MAG: aminomethyl-transferring glycine dehydrogenase subunit GcvPA [Chloroflexi bacterium]|jgi:glycine dehydrogenase subunit 1|nr:aminomethyl-transferring glycine dehydrogenase subunit GcvPA [Chloroflexota bacterium]MBV6435485.1 putative glycine dehydrogenase (decarboxylating) subunit 1 [Anaerolineae bacterium]MDL1914416.1 aminomethyl-transferring glycine dehydrogenase subunit GcvPA [Anaerolineae bacterium CFX4]OQY83158.1 MAG: glycine dehydrogenase (aminomethyl-transferring) [Anaerolineae bacterium UTCFX5]MBW7879483.1 aminomethyl-transferring glycine dehydrogenase subunit GcvPA [Anaerolineae bacterium]